MPDRFGIIIHADGESIKFQSRYVPPRRCFPFVIDRSSGRCIHFSNVWATTMRYIKLETHCRKHGVYRSSMERSNTYATVIRESNISRIPVILIMRCEFKDFRPCLIQPYSAILINQRCVGIRKFVVFSVHEG